MAKAKSGKEELSAARQELLAGSSDFESATPAAATMLEAPPPAQAVAAALRPAPSIDLAGELAAQERRLQLGEELFERLARDGVGAGLTGHEHARLVETMLDAADRLFLESLGYGSRQIQKGIWRWASILQWRSQVPALAQRQQATAARDAAIAQLQREAPGIEERIRQLQDELAALQEREATTTQICLKHAAGIAALRELVPEHVKRVVSRRRRDIKNRYQLSELDTELNFANGLRQLVEGKPDEHSALAVAQTRWPDLIDVLPADGTRLFRAAPGVTWPKFVQRARVYLANEVPPLAAKKAAAVAELQAELEGVDAPLNCLVPA